MPLIIDILDADQCPDILPVLDSLGGIVIVEKRCVLLKGHTGLHRDFHGACWVNQHDLMRQRGIEE